ncbi:MAG: NAD(P)H-hydrate dehydratase [Oscillospiraceae bacterium]|nr:NAD(P)H-hydrate dehydratase [Oscillospiraceae bacterium]
MRVVTTQQMRKLEALADKSGVSYKKLMDNAGMCLAQKIEFCAQKTIANPDIVFLCGSGNNAGDCFTAASLLRESSYNIYVCLLCGEPKTQISLEAYKSLRNVRIIDNYEGALRIIDKAEIIVDGLFGTGFHGELSPELRTILNKNKEAIKIAVDIPSGGNGDTGAACYGCFCADYTITFGYKKFGMTQYPLKNYCGKIEVCDIGIPDFCLQMLDEDLQEIDDSIITGIIKPRNPDSHKGTYGTVLCLTGSASMPGAGVLSSRAALRCGAGLVKVCAVKEDIPSLASVMPEAVYISMKSDKDGFYTADNIKKIESHLSSAQAVLIGCGLGVTDETKKLVREIILTADCPVVLDADGINCIADCIDIISKAKSKIILTPHPKEMAGLLKCSAAQVQSDRLDKCRSFISENKNAVLVLKGAGTIIMDSKKAYINNTGNPGMSCGGSGDVLSGMIASFAALKTDPFLCAVLGVNLHGRAGDAAAQRYSMSYMQPSDIISCLPDIFLKLEKAVNVKRK